MQKKSEFISHQPGYSSTQRKLASSERHYTNSTKEGPLDQRVEPTPFLLRVLVSPGSDWNLVTTLGCWWKFCGASLSSTPSPPLCLTIKTSFGEYLYIPAGSYSSSWSRTVYDHIKGSHFVLSEFTPPKTVSKGIHCTHYYLEIMCWGCEVG